MTVYRTPEAQRGAITIIDGCIKAINEQPELPYKMGTLTVDYITQFLAEYKKLVEKDLQRCTKAAAERQA